MSSNDNSAVQAVKHAIYLQNSLINSHRWQCCLNCEYWCDGTSKTNERNSVPLGVVGCSEHKGMPPPNVIVVGCPDHLGDVPF